MINFVFHKFLIFWYKFCKIWRTLSAYMNANLTYDTELIVYNLFEIYNLPFYFKHNWLKLFILLMQLSTSRFSIYINERNKWRLFLFKYSKLKNKAYLYATPENTCNATQEIFRVLFSFTSTGSMSLLMDCMSLLDHQLITGCFGVIYNIGFLYFRLINEKNY